VVGEVALSLVLVASAGLLLRSFVAVTSVDPGFEPDDVWTVPLNLAGIDSPARYVEVMDQVQARAAQVPGVLHAAYGLTMPMEMVGGTSCCWRTPLRASGREEDPELLSMVHPVSDGYFATLGIPVLFGRTWSKGDGRDEPIPLVVGEMLARELATEPAAALGTFLGINSYEGVVVGVVPDTRHFGLDQPLRSTVYLPVERLPFPISQAHLAVRADPNVSSTVPEALRQAVRSAAPGVPVPEVRSMSAWMRSATADRRFDSQLFGTFAAVTLLLAAGGLYGTLLYTAGQRRRELGIRLALGASRGSVERGVLRGGLTVGALGVLVGLLAAWLSTRLLESRIWGVEGHDPVALVGAAAVLLITTVLASWLPARRAARVDPLETLRVE
jgi:predicted permease